MRPTTAALLLLSLLPMARAGYPTKPVLFVTQVPMPDEINSRVATDVRMSCVSPIQNSQGDTHNAGRGGALMIYYPAATNPSTTQGTVVNLTAKAGYGVVNVNGVSTGLQAGANAIAVQRPFVHWSGTKAIFSMVAGAPATPSDATVFHWQLYEISNFDKASVTNGSGPIITKVPNQPNYNNLHACYGTDGRIIFTSDQPRGGLTHLYPQRDEYLLQPINTGLWSLDPTTGNLFQILHTPSGAYFPFIDSYGRLMFTQWDHLTRDPAAVTDRAPITANGDNWVQTNNGMGNFLSEAAGATFSVGTNDTYPEPRNFDKTSLLTAFLNGHNINGNATNLFFFWMINEDGSGHEIINHLGRHEIQRSGLSVFPNQTPAIDPNLVDFNATGRKFVDQMLAFTESGTTPGLYYGIDGPDLGTHGAGQIVSLTGAPGLNPDQSAASHMTLSYVAPTSTALPKPNAPTAANPGDTYRNVCSMTDGTMVVSWSLATQFDVNKGTATAPLSYFDFRLRTMKQGNAATTPGIGLIPDFSLTGGLQGVNLQWYDNGATISYNGPLWELDPVEVVAKAKPAKLTSTIDPVEAQVFVEEGVDAPTLQNYLRAREMALVVSRDVTHRDAADKQQPYNLRIAGTTHQTVANAGTLYDIGWMQIMQADLLRGLTNGAAVHVAGRRVLPTPLHDTISEMPTVAGAPPGAVKLGPDGSLAAVVPARRALTWHLTNGNGPTTQSIVKEKFWVGFGAGEIRTCANCHGINSTDQAGQPKPTNKPQALRDFLQFWKSNNPPGKLQHATASVTALKSAGTATLHVQRTAGTVGPVSVNFSVSGTAVAGQDFTAPASTTLTWADGDTADKLIIVPLLNPATIGPAKSLTATLTSPVNGSLGTITAATLQIQEPPFQAWQYTNFTTNANNPSLAADNADPDHDGLENLLEYALNSNPNSTTSGVLPVAARQTVGGMDSFVLTFSKDTTKSDLTYQAQWSTNLTGGSWTDLQDTLVGPSGGIETHQASVPATNVRVFLRLKVTRL